VLIVGGNRDLPPQPVDEPRQQRAKKSRKG
jgi:hypothetical protein